MGYLLDQVCILSMFMVFYVFGKLEEFFVFYGECFDKWLDIVEYYFK